MKKSSDRYVLKINKMPNSAEDQKFNSKHNSDSKKTKTETGQELSEIEQDSSVKKPNPTVFGDWQINCRTIDF